MSQSRKITKDTYLFREGDLPDAMYIIKSGQLAVTKTKGNSEVVLAEIKSGAMVGEMAVFDKKPRSANVKATKDTEVIALPYDALDKQLDALPVWIKAIMKTMNENLREANKKIKILESSNADAERFPPHVVNQMISLINLVGAKFGTKDENGHIVIPANKLRNFTIQIFQLPTNKMDAMQEALEALGMFKVEDLGEGRKKLTNKNADFLVEFVDWYNEWLFKQEKDKVQVSLEEVKLMNGLLHFAKKAPANDKGMHEINLNEVQNDSMKEVGFLIKVDDVNGLIEKKLISEKMMKEGGVFVAVHVAEVDKPTQFWQLVWGLKSALR